MWKNLPYTAGFQDQDLNGDGGAFADQSIVFTDFSGNRHIVASPDDLTAGLNFSMESIRASTMGNGDYLITYAVRDDMQMSSDLYYRVFDTDTGDFVGQAEHLGQMGGHQPYGLYMEEPGRVYIRDFDSYLFSGEVVSDGNGNISAEFNFNDPTNYDLSWKNYDYGSNVRVSEDNVPEHSNDNASPYAHSVNTEFDLAAYITESNGEWQLKANLFNRYNESQNSKQLIIANDIFVPVVEGEEPPFVNIARLGENKFGINLAKMDANGVVHQLKYTEVVIQPPANSWGNYWGTNIQETYSATVDYPVMPEIKDLLLTSDGNVILDVKESQPTLSDGSEVIGSKSLFDLSNFNSSVTGVFNENIIGTSHDD